MNRLAIVMIALLCLLLHSCGSKRNAQRQTDYPSEQPTEQTEDIPLPPGTAGAVITEAERWLGTPYKYGGKQRGSGTDCSGMVMMVYEAATGIQLPRNATKQQLYCRAIDKSELQPGDLVFFSSSSRGGRVSHVGIYRGSGEFIHASSSKGVIVSNLDQQYYRNHYHSAGRVLSDATTPAAPSTSPAINHTATAKPTLPEDANTDTTTPIDSLWAATAMIPSTDTTRTAMAVLPEAPACSTETVQPADSTHTADPALQLDIERRRFEDAMRRAQLDLDSIIVNLVDSINAPENTQGIPNATP